MNAPPIKPTAAEIAAAQEVLDAAKAETTATVESQSAPETSTVETPETESEKDATIKKLQEQVASLGTTPVVETDAQKIERLESQVKTLLGSVGSAVAPLTQALGITSPDIKWSSIEPGLKYAVKAGLIKVEDLGEHVVKLFEENL